MARTSNFSNIATVTRASKKTDAGGWDFQSGSVVGALAEYDNNVAAIHPTAGLRHEQATTNEIRNPRGEGASGATEPTNWAIPSSWDAIATWSTGTLNGWPYARVDFDGTPSGALSLSFEGNSQITASQGQDWCVSVGLQLASGNFTNIDFVNLRHREGNSSSGFVDAQDSSDILSSIDGSHRRFFHPGELSHASTAYVTPQIVMGYTSGAVNFSLYIFAPQTEQKDNPTGPVFPSVGSPAAASRAADVVSIPNGAWVSSGDFSLFVDYCPDYVTGGTKYILLLGSVSDGLRTFYRTAGNTFIVASGGVTQVNLDGDVPSSGVSRKIAAGVAADNFALSVNGATQLTDSSCLVPSVAGDLLLGSFNTAGGFAIDGYIKDFRYWPRRLSNAELEALVGN